MIQNDIADYQIDKLNSRKNIPLATDSIDRETLQKLLVGLSIITVLVAWMLGGNALLVTGFYLILGWLYSGPANFKNNGYLAIVLLGICYGFLPWWLGWAVVGVDNTLTLIVFSASSFLFSCAVVMLKDFKDYKGDKAYGKRTILVLYGPNTVRLVSLILMGLAHIVLLLFFLMNEKDLLLSGLTLASLLAQTIILNSKKISINTEVRRRNGNFARFGFYAVILCSFIITNKTL